jgi:nucleotide-binding universal stress UspA family protein
MTIRRMLLPLTGAASDAAVLATALLAAAHLKAHVDAVLLVRLPHDDGLLLVESPVPEVLKERVSADLAASREAAVEAASNRFAEACAAARVPLVAQPPSDGASARWLGAFTADELIREAAVADLIVLGHPGGVADAPLANIRETALLSGGRPLLLAPTTAPGAVGRTVAVAWNGTPPAARAVTAALPLLVRAQSVRVLTARTGRTRDAQAHRLIEYLAWHRVGAEAVVVDPAGESVGAALLRRAAELETDLLVMGGYGHSRWRELLLGGVTRHVFDRAVLPVLMAH